MSDFEIETTGAEMRPHVQRTSKLPWALFGLALLLGVASGYVMNAKLKEAREDSARAVLANQQITQHLHETQDAQRALESEISLLRSQGDALTADRDSLSQSLEQLKSTYDTLQDRLKSEIKKGDVHLSQAGGKIRVDLVDQILFESGQAALSNRGMEVLSRVGQVLARVEDRQIQVSGHTDDSPITDRLKTTYASNWDLSAARAVNVVRFLSESAGVPAKRLAAAAYGQFQPVSTNATPLGRARNRRIEILLMPALAPKPTQLADAVAPAGDSKKDAHPASSARKAKAILPVKKTRNR